MEKSLEEKETLSQDGIIRTSDVELEDTFVWPMSTIIENVSCSFCALISHSLVKRSLLTYLIVCLRTGSSLIELWTWTVSRRDV
jgi:predicted DNA-binding ribbon-helix-helix protein